MTPFKWIKMFIYPHQGDFDFSKHWLQAVCIFFNKWKYGVNNGFRWWNFFLLSSTLNINNFLYNGTNWFKFSTFFCLQLPSLYLIAKKKKGKKEKSGCFSWMLCTLLSGLSDFQLDPRGRNQGFYNVVCQRMFLFCKRPGLDHILFHDFKIGHLREILIYGLP